MLSDRGFFVRHHTGHWFTNPALLLFLAIVGSIGSLSILRSDGFYPIDECAHYLYSRFILDVLPVTVQTWHRPGLLWLFALPAQFGHTATMFFGLALFLVLLLVTYRIAVLKGIRHPEWVVLLTGLQPVLFDISYACLAEAPAALLLVLSYWLHLKQKPGWCLAIASTVFLFRFEMYAFAVLMSAIYLMKRQWRILPLLVLGPVIWIGSSTIISGDPMTFFREWSHFSGLGKYVDGISLTFYLENLHTIFGVAQVAFFAIGVVFIALGRKMPEYALILSVPVIGIIVNTLAGAEMFHWSGSIGDLRYVAVAGPFLGIVSAYGLSEALERLPHTRLRMALAPLLAGALILNCLIATHPRQWTEEERIVIALTRELRSGYPDQVLLCNSYIAAYVLDVPPWGGPHFARLDARTLAEHQECVMVWDPFLSNPRFSRTELTREQLLEDPANVVLKRQAYQHGEFLLLSRNVRPSSPPHPLQ